jgi:flagellin
MAISGLTGIPLDPALIAYQRNSASLSTSEIRLSSGLRLIHTGDDTASATAASALQTQNSTLRSSLTNGAHASTLLQIADHSLSQIRTILDSLSSLTQTANGHGLTTTQYALLDGQFQQQKAQIDAIVGTSTYNGANLLDGTFNGSGAAQFQLGSVSGSGVGITIPSVTSASLFSTPTSLGNASAAATATVNVGNAQDTLNDAIAKVAAYQVRIDEAEDATRSSIKGVRNATRDLLDTDTSSEANTLATTTLRQYTAAAIFAQALGINANLLSLIH